MYTSEKEYLKHYNIHNYDVPLVSVDVAIFTMLDGKLYILMVERGEFPHKTRWALPGGFINQKQDKDLHATALRKLTEKTGVKTPYLEQVTTIGNSDRDPRGWSVTSLYMALIAHTPTAKFIDAVTDARWWPVDEAIKQTLAFDHADLIEQARERLRAKAGYTALPMYILNAPFTLTQLQETYEELLGAKLEKKSFRRKFPVDELLEDAGEALPESGRGRIAALYRPKKGGESYTFLRSFGAGENI
ncbi:MAG: NUDIX domain-containing protein [Cellvibrio sp.]